MYLSPREVTSCVMWMAVGSWTHSLFFNSYSHYVVPSSSFNNFSILDMARNGISHSMPYLAVLLTIPLEENASWSRALKWQAEEYSWLWGGNMLWDIFLKQQRNTWIKRKRMTSDCQKTKDSNQVSLTTYDSALKRERNSWRVPLLSLKLIL